jgi:hypothetical protein
MTLCCFMHEGAIALHCKMQQQDLAFPRIYISAIFSFLPHCAAAKNFTRCLKMVGGGDHDYPLHNAAGKFDSLLHHAAGSFSPEFTYFWILRYS